MPIQIGTFPEPGPGENRFVIYEAQLFWLFLCSVYVFTEPFIGVLTFIWGQLGLMTMIWLKDMDDKEQILGGKFFNIIVAMKLFGWGTQFVGHGVFERRAPAILTNFLFMYIAPFFWTFELLNKLFEYREVDVKACLSTIEADIAFYR